MKNIRQTFAMIFTMIFMVGAAIPSYATGTTGSLTITNNKKNTGVSMQGHTYSAYKIFDLVSSSEDKYVYSVDADFKVFFEYKAKQENVEVNTSAKLNAFATDYLDKHDNIEALAKEFKDYIVARDIEIEKESKDVVTEGDIETVTISGLPLGYYLVLDKGLDPESKEESVIAALALRTTNTTEISLKALKPGIDKEIQHNDDGNWGNVGDNQIGDTVNYRLKATVPNVEGYDTYKYIIHDTMSAGLKFNPNSIKIYTDENMTSPLEGYHTLVHPAQHGDVKHTFDLTIDVKKAIEESKVEKGDTLYIHYTAILTEDAVIAPDSNDNTVNLEYSNNPFDGNETTTTPDETVEDYTFKIEGEKVDEKFEALEGAEFKLYEGKEEMYFKQSTENGVNIYTVCTGNHDENDGCTSTITPGSKEYGCKFEIRGLDDETEYTLKEVTVPAGHNGIEPIIFKIQANYTTNPMEVSVMIKDGNEFVSADGILIQIVNTTGDKLPETGGMGTTLFTVVGGGLMATAAVLLMRKNKSEQE